MEKSWWTFRCVTWQPLLWSLGHFCLHLCVSVPYDIPLANCFLPIPAHTQPPPSNDLWLGKLQAYELALTYFPACTAVGGEVRSPDRGRSWPWVGHAPLALPNPFGLLGLQRKENVMLSFKSWVERSEGLREVKSLPNWTNLQCAELEPEPRLQTPVLSPMEEIEREKS